MLLLAAWGQVISFSVPRFPHLKWGECRCLSHGATAQGELSLRLGRDPGGQNTGPKQSWFLIAGT